MELGSATLQADSLTAEQPGNPKGMYFSPVDTLILDQWDFLQNCKTISSCYFKLVSLFSFLTAPEKAIATHSSTLAWKIPGTAEPGALPSMGSHRVRHNWSNLAAAAAYSTDRKPMYPPRVYFQSDSQKDPIKTEIRSYHFLKTLQSSSCFPSHTEQKAKDHAIIPHPTHSTLCLLSPRPHRTFTMHSRLLLPSRPIGAHLFKTSFPQIFHVFLSQLFRSLLKCHLLSKTFPCYLI